MTESKGELCKVLDRAGSVGPRRVSCHSQCPTGRGQRPKLPGFCPPCNELNGRPRPESPRRSTDLSMLCNYILFYVIRELGGDRGWLYGPITISLGGRPALISSLPPDSIDISIGNSSIWSVGDLLPLTGGIQVETTYSQCILYWAERINPLRNKNRSSAAKGWPLFLINVMSRTNAWPS